MASYQLIKDEGKLDLHGKNNNNNNNNNNNCTLRIDGGGFVGDVESALHKLNSSSPRPRSGFNENGKEKGCTPPTPPPSSVRLVSLDVFRGLTVVLMILVDDVGGILPSINHSPWNGLTLADFVMPFFLFMVGVSLALVYKNMPCQVAASKKAMCRAGKLLLLGVFLQGGFFHGINNLTYGVNMERIRWMGILQRIAIANWVAAICEIWLRNHEKEVDDSRPLSSLLKKYQWHWAMMFTLTALYLVLTYGLYVPDWEYQVRDGADFDVKTIMLKVRCGVRGNTEPACNAAGMIDRLVLGIQHLYQKPIYARAKQCSINSPDYGPLPPDAPSWCQAPFDPEGILSTVLAIVTCMIGLQYGHVLVHFKDHKNRLLLWLVPSSAFIALGLLCEIFGMHINKAVYSFSYMCVTTGAAGILFAVIYLMVDAYGWRRFTVVLQWMGMNALLIYVLVACNILPLILQGFYWRQPHNNILNMIGIGKHNH